MLEGRSRQRTLLIFKYHHGQSNVLGAMLRIAQRIQRDGHYEARSQGPMRSAATLAAAALHPRALRALISRLQHGRFA